jgi:etoposide-induced 2.4 mRNA
MWYAEIAERTAFAAQREAQQRLVDATKVITPAPTRLLQVRQTDTMTALSQQTYSAFVFLVHLFVSIIIGKLPLPYIGPVLSFILFSSLYALYCFDYKWNLHGVPLEHRTQSVEEHWAYFSGFGALMVLVASKLPFFTGSAVGLLLYPLFIVSAADANPREAYLNCRQWFQQRGQVVKFPRLPLFTPTVQVTNFCLGIVQRQLSTASKKPGLPKPRVNRINDRGIKKQTY